jgi:hypothetical protein
VAIGGHAQEPTKQQRQHNAVVGAPPLQMEPGRVGPNQTRVLLGRGEGRPPACRDRELKRSSHHGRNSPSQSGCRATSRSWGARSVIGLARRRWNGPNLVAEGGRFDGDNGGARAPDGSGHVMAFIDRRTLHIRIEAVWIR